MDDAIMRSELSIRDSPFGSPERNPPSPEELLVTKTSETFHYPPSTGVKVDSEDAEACPTSSPSRDLSSPGTSRVNKKLQSLEITSPVQVRVKKEEPDDSDQSSLSDMAREVLTKFPDLKSQVENRIKKEEAEEPRIFSGIIKTGELGDLADHFMHGMLKRKAGNSLPPTDLDGKNRPKKVLRLEIPDSEDDSDNDESDFDTPNREFFELYGELPGQIPLRNNIQLHVQQRNKVPEVVHSQGYIRLETDEPPSNCMAVFSHSKIPDLPVGTMVYEHLPAKPKNLSLEALQEWLEIPPSYSYYIPRR